MKKSADTIRFTASGTDTANANKLLDKWRKFLPDFHAAVESFAREEIRDIHINGIPLGAVATARFEDACKKLTELSTSRALVEAYKIAFICETLLMEAHKPVPAADNMQLCQAIGEAISLASIDHNPVRIISDAMNSLRYVVPEGQYVIRDVTLSQNIRGRIDFTFAVSKNVLSCDVTRKAAYQLTSDATEEEDPPRTFTCKMHKSFDQPDSPWSGVLSK